MSLQSTSERLVREMFEERGQELPAQLPKFLDHALADVRSRPATSEHTHVLNQDLACVCGQRIPFYTQSMMAGVR